VPKHLYLNFKPIVVLFVLTSEAVASQYRYRNSILIWNVLS